MPESTVPKAKKKRKRTAPTPAAVGQSSVAAAHPEAAVAAAKTAASAQIGEAAPLQPMNPGSAELPKHKKSKNKFKTAEFLEKSKRDAATGHSKQDQGVAAASDVGRAGTSANAAKTGNNHAQAATTAGSKESKHKKKSSLPAATPAERPLQTQVKPSSVAHDKAPAQSTLANGTAAAVPRKGKKRRKQAEEGSAPAPAPAQQQQQPPDLPPKKKAKRAKSAAAEDVQKPQGAPAKSKVVTTIAAGSKAVVATAKAGGEGVATPAVAVAVKTTVAEPGKGVVVGSNWLALKAIIGAGQKKPAAAAGEPGSAAGLPRPLSRGSKTGLTKVVALDCEMVGVGPGGERSMLARVCIVNEEGNVLLDKFVQPKERVTDFRTQFSGIRPESFSQADEFEEVQLEVAKTLDGRILVGHGLQHDLQVLLLSHPHRAIRDTARYPPLMRSVGPTRRMKPRALRHLAEEQLGLAIQEGEHSPVDDARAALYLYLKHRKEWERSIKQGFKMTGASVVNGVVLASKGKTLAELAAVDDMVDL